VPEGDTIWRTAAALRPRLSGKVVRAAEPAPLRRLVGQQVTAVEANGKHLLVHFEGGLTLHTHMRMRGAWHVYPPGARWRLPRHRVRALLRFDDVDAVLFNAPVVELTRDAGAGLSHLGPDILAEPFDTEEVVQRARASERATVGELLLEQRVCAGIGNIYKCESLWRLGIDPWTPPAALDDARLAALYSAARDLMRASLAGLASRPRAVHGRGGRPCPRCGARILVRAQGEQGRLTYWCPACQPGIAPYTRPL